MLDPVLRRPWRRRCIQPLRSAEGAGAGASTASGKDTDAATAAGSGATGVGGAATSGAVGAGGFLRKKLNIPRLSPQASAAPRPLAIIGGSWRFSSVG